jgi:hypothetical protein
MPDPIPYSDAELEVKDETGRESEEIMSDPPQHVKSNT